MKKSLTSHHPECTKPLDAKRVYHPCYGRKLFCSSGCRQDYLDNALERTVQRLRECAAI